MDEKEEIVSSITAFNRLEAIRFDYRIMFNNFSTRSIAYESNVFSPPGLDEPTFVIRCQPNFQLQKSENTGGYDSRPRNVTYYYLQLNLIVQKSSRKIFHVSCNTSLVDQDGKKFYENKISSDVLGTANSSTVLLDLPKASYPLSSLKSQNLLNDDMLTFLCEFTIDLDTNTEKVLLADKLSTGQLLKQSKKKILEDLGTMWKSGQFADLVLQFKGGKELKAHKAVLAARSEIFAAMFRHDCKEAKENRVEITDLSVEVFEVLLDYIYTGKVPELQNCDLAEELLMAADKYQLDILKAICEDSLCAQLSPENVSNYLLLGDTHSAPKLKEKALDYFQKNAQDSISALFGNNRTDVLLQAFKEIAIKGSKRK